MKNIKKSLRSVFCALLAAAALAASLPAYAVSQAEIDDLQKKLDALEQQAQEQQDVINDLTSQKARFITRKLALDNKIEINRQMIELIGEQIEIYDEIIAEKQAELDKALEKETTQTELLRSRIRAMEENSTYSYASFIFDSSSVTELLSRIGDVNDIMHYDKTLEEEYMAAREDVESIKKSYEEARHEQELLQKELDTKQAELDAQVEAAYTMIADIETLSDDAQAEYDAIALAMESLQSANTALQNRFSPALSRRAGELFSRLTGGKYESVLLDRTFSAQAGETGESVSHDAQLLSLGTLDQLYLAVRLAICESALPVDDPPPIVLDDALVRFDDERCRAALELLLEESKSRQILLFTCQHRESVYLSGRDGVTFLSL